MRLLLIGPPGCGKGTQGARIAERYSVEHIAAGDILRAEVAAETALGRQIGGYISAGALVPDQVILDVVVPKVLAAAKTDGYVLDGFPRTILQAAAARRIAEEHGSAVRCAIYMKVPQEELLARLLRRADIEGRSDDKPDVIRRRLQVFTDATAPLIDFYAERGLLDVVDATLTPDQVTEQILTALPALVRARPVPS
ncbi:MAG: adenylate kinase [Actinomycetota bacterium]|nr:adenylate kinase [Actinomycetota bacterium]